jgi:23S rRNA pseudouridine2605 synthase
MHNKNIEKKIRLNRFLAQCGLGSRRECDGLIASGRIIFNGKKVVKLGTQVDPASDRIQYKGKLVRNIRKLQYVAYHKSRGTVVTAKDPQGRETIYTALEKGGFRGEHLNYIGRLDRNSEGLLLLTNDGDLVHALTHPRFHIKKVYQVKINKNLHADDLNIMINSGVDSEGQKLIAGAIRKIESKAVKSGFWYEIDLYEGKNRQIRRMFEGLGYEIVRLKRIQFSSIKLGKLARGRYRFLTDREISGLKSKGYKK